MDEARSGGRLYHFASHPGGAKQGRKGQTRTVSVWGGAQQSGKKWSTEFRLRNGLRRVLESAEKGRRKPFESFQPTHEPNLD